MFITALNPYRQFDGFYEGFLDLITGQIAASINNAAAYEQERKRAEELSELDRAKTAFFSQRESRAAHSAYAHSGPH